MMEQGKELDEPIDDIDAGLHYPIDYALTTWRHFRDHGVYPEPGGYNDQDAALMADWSFLNTRYSLQAAGSRADALHAFAKDGKHWKDIL